MSKNIGRFEYVKRGLVGVCAATILAGMCAVPAFAKDATNGKVVDVPGAGSEGSSAVVLDAADLQVSATVPSTLPVVISGNTITFPTKAQITSTGKAGIVVSGVKADQASGVSDLVLKEDGTALGDNELFIAVNGTAIVTSGKTPTSAIPLATDLTFTGDFGKLKGTPLDTIVKGDNVKLFDIVWTLALDTATV